MEGKHHRGTQSKAEQTSPRKPGDFDKMDTEELEWPSSRQITPAEKSIFSDKYTLEMSLDDVYVSLDCYCELRR